MRFNPSLRAFLSSSAQGSVEIDAIGDPVYRGIAKSRTLLLGDSREPKLDLSLALDAKGDKQVLQDFFSALPGECLEES